MAGMLEMPPVQYAAINGIRMAYYEAGPKTGNPPVILCHGWPECAFTWRHQIKALAAAGVHVIVPDQRGYGLSECPKQVTAYDMEHLSGDLVGLLDHLKIDKAIFVGHDWGGFIVWQMPLRHQARVAGVIGVNTPHTARPPVDPIAIYRKRFGDDMYLVYHQVPGAAEKVYEADIEKTMRFFMRRPPAKSAATQAPASASPGAAPAPKPNLAFQYIIPKYDPSKDTRPELLTPEELAVFVAMFKHSGFAGGVNWYRNITRNWERSADLDHTVRVPSLMVMAERDVVLPPSAADGMEKIIPDLEKVLVRDCGHWTQQEKPEELSRIILDWRQKRFG